MSDTEIRAKAINQARRMRASHAGPTYQRVSGGAMASSPCGEAAKLVRRKIFLETMGRERKTPITVEDAARNTEHLIGGDPELDKPSKGDPLPEKPGGLSIPNCKKPGDHFNARGRDGREDSLSWLGSEIRDAAKAEGLPPRVMFLYSEEEYKVINERLSRDIDRLGEHKPDENQRCHNYPYDWEAVYVREVSV